MRGVMCFCCICNRTTQSGQRRGRGSRRRKVRSLEARGRRSRRFLHRKLERRSPSRSDEATTSLDAEKVANFFQEGVKEKQGQESAAAILPLTSTSPTRCRVLFDFGARDRYECSVDAGSIVVVRCRLCERRWREHHQYLCYIQQ